MLLGFTFGFIVGMIVTLIGLAVGSAIKANMTPAPCPHGHDNPDDCPVCNH